MDESLIAGLLYWDADFSAIRLPPCRSHRCS